MVPQGGIEPPTRGFSVLCSTNWATEANPKQSIERGNIRIRFQALEQRLNFSFDFRISLLNLRLVTPTGFEPVLPPWKGGVLDHLTKGPKLEFESQNFLMVSHPRLERGTPWLKVRCSTCWANGSNTLYFGGPSGTRTPDTLIKSQVLYQLS